MELREELLEISEGGGPVGVEVGFLVGRAGAEGLVLGEALFKDRDDFGWAGVWTRCLDVATVAEGFEIWDLAARIEGGEFFDGFRKWDFEGVDDFWGRRGG